MLQQFLLKNYYYYYYYYYYEKTKLEFTNIYYNTSWYDYILKVKVQEQRERLRKKQRPKRNGPV